MDWLRRNWPDLLIGLALIAVIAGIVATLLTGGSFFPLGGSTVQPAPSQPSVSSPVPDVDPSPAGGEPAASESDGPEVAVLPPAGSSSDTTPPGAPSTDVLEGSSAEPAPSEVTPLSPDPSAPDGQAGAVDPTPAAAAAGDGATPAPAATSTPEATPQPSSSVPDQQLPSDPYRVAVGAFGQRENAETQAARFRAAGYPVFLGTQDALTLVLVGPYDDEGEAERVADEIRSGDFDVDPVIYLFEPGDETSDGTSDGTPDDAGPPAAPVAANGGATPASSASASAAPSAESVGTRLQAGAYADPAASQPQIERLESLGFAVESVSEGGLVKLLVGPFTGDALADARVILDGAGIDYFAR